MHFPVFLIHFPVFTYNTFSAFLIHFSVFLIHYLCINQSHVACDVRAWRKSGPWSPLGKYRMYSECSTQLTTGLACTLSITREYMELGGRLPANCVLTVYYLPVYPPYSDSNYGLCSFAHTWYVTTLGT
jgi:hypothetical protein